MLKFAIVSAVVHLMLLAPWPAPMLPDYRSDTVLSVGLVSLDRTTALTDSVPNQESRPIETKPSRAKPEQIRDNERGNNVDTPARTRAVAKLRVDKIRRKPENRRNDPMVTKTIVPIPFSERSKTTTVTGMPRQQRLLDKPIAIRSTDKLEQTRALISTTTGDEAKSASAYIRGKLRTDLARYFSYPTIARRRGWQGHVQIGFRLQPDGKLTDIYVARSSGYRLLDKSAIKALRQVKPIAEAATLLKGKSIDIELPVIYRLEQP